MVQNSPPWPPPRARSLAELETIYRKQQAELESGSGQILRSDVAIIRREALRRYGVDLAATKP